MESCSNEIKPINNGLSITTKPISSHLLQATVEVSPEVTDTLFKQMANIYAKNIQPKGLSTNILPIEFVKEEHSTEILGNVKRFLLKHMVLDYLLTQITVKKIPIANHPRLTGMKINKDRNSTYNFDISIASQIPLKEWKLFTFKSPKRKRYKDLDKQVDLFIKREQIEHKKHDKHCVENNDWINFEATLINEKNDPLLPAHKTSLWMKINTKYIEKPFQKVFLGKKAGDTFCTCPIPVYERLQDYISDNCPFLITIKSVTKGSNLSVDALKTIFKLKNKSDLHTKLIEVFSYRNDISQRRSIIEEIFHLFFSKHRFEIPKHLTIRKQESLLSAIKKQPDYQVYKSQNDFHEKVALLAEKLLKEEILIDQITYKENIKATRKDIKYYLTLFNNSRLKELVYFKPAFEPFEENDSPIYEGHLRQAVQREKTLNHIINTLTG